MKTMKLTLVAILIAFTAVNIANADGIHSKPGRVVECTLTQAMSIPGLVQAIYNQVDPILINNQHIITIAVVYNGTIYRITGTATQWYAFFGPNRIIRSKIKTAFSLQD